MKKVIVGAVFLAALGLMMAPAFGKPVVRSYVLAKPDAPRVMTLRELNPAVKARVVLFQTAGPASRSDRLAPSVKALNSHIKARVYLTLASDKAGSEATSVAGSTRARGRRVMEQRVRPR